MATKYVLIPDDMYKSLMSEKKEKNDEIGKDLYKIEMDKLIKKPQKNKVSNAERNILYNQELARYLKEYRKEKKNLSKLN